MPSAVAFFPLSIKLFVNLATSLSLNLGSGMMRRFGTSRRRGISYDSLARSLNESRFEERLRLRPLDAVLRALAVAGRLVGAARARGARGVERAADHVVANTRQVL